MATFSPLEVQHMIDVITMQAQDLYLPPLEPGARASDSMGAGMGVRMSDLRNISPNSIA